MKQEGFMQAGDEEVKSPSCCSSEGIRGNTAFKSWSAGNAESLCPSSGCRLEFVVEGSELGKVNKKMCGEYHVMAEGTVNDYL